MVVDALSKKHKAVVDCAAISSIVPLWIQELDASYQGEPKTDELIIALMIDPKNRLDYLFYIGLLKSKGKLYVGKGNAIREKLIQNIHSS